MQILLRWAATTAALYITVWILHALDLAEFGTGPWYAWFVAVIIMALVNALIRPIARLLTAPLNCLTFGIIGVLINAVMFWLVPEIAKGLGMPIFSVSPLGALAGSILVGLLGAVLSKLVKSRDDKDDE